MPQELRDRVMDKERQVVATFAAVIVEIEPGLKKRSLDKAVAMILFGMINWTFTWLRADGPLSYADMAPVVTQIFMNGIAGLDQRMSSRRTRSRRNVADAVAEDAPAGTA